MRNYEVLRPHVWGGVIVGLEKVATITARSAQHALHIAKQKGHLAPIIGEAK